MKLFFLVEVLLDKGKEGFENESGESLGRYLVLDFFLYVIFVRDWVYCCSFNI